MSDLIKTGFVIEVTKNEKECDVTIHSKVEQWISASLLSKKIKEKQREYPTTTSSEWNENGSVKEFVDWFLSLLEAK
jgi:hypothetical protein